MAEEQEINEKNVNPILSQPIMIMNMNSWIPAMMKFMGKLNVDVNDKTIKHCIQQITHLTNEKIDGKTIDDAIMKEMEKSLKLCELNDQEIKNINTLIDKMDADAKTVLLALEILKIKEELNIVPIANEDKKIQYELNIVPIANEEKNPIYNEAEEDVGDEGHKNISHVDNTTQNKRAETINQSLEAESNKKTNVNSSLKNITSQTATITPETSKQTRNVTSQIKPSIIINKKIQPNIRPVQYAKRNPAQHIEQLQKNKKEMEVKLQNMNNENANISIKKRLVQNIAKIERKKQQIQKKIDKIRQIQEKRMIRNKSRINRTQKLLSLKNAMICNRSF